MEHMDHMIDVMGEDHVGFGFDFCDQFLTSSSPQDLTRMPYVSFDLVGGHGALPEFIEELRAHGYSEERLKKVAGENWLRLFKNTFGK